jgi:16S rRNA A1518/A1519 N6-dimethyltransferase RsmA/KsgA/DIM1 with predicted DNA glycosylase/AP lyase activity
MSTRSSELKFSQNFVKKPELVGELLDQSGLTADDIVLEIGPGTGVITRQLTQRCAAVIAIEADPVLARALKQSFQDQTKVTIVTGDFLQYPLPDTVYKVFANIPFNITADVVRKLVQAPNPPEVCYLFVQAEAATKLAGPPLGEHETQFSIMTKPAFEMIVTHQFHRHDFAPAPAVDVVLLRIALRNPALLDAALQPRYRDFISFAFHTNRPNLKKALEPVLTYQQFKRLAQDLEFSLSAKPTELSLGQWLGLFAYFEANVSLDKQQLVQGAAESWDRRQRELTKIHRTRTAKNWRQTKH